jgi:hypothetical protein
MTTTAPDFLKCEGCEEDFPPSELSVNGLCENCDDEIGSNWDDFDPWDDDYEIRFANPGSALRAATPDDPRIHPCPTCGAPNRLTQQDVDLHYQCDTCADRAEMGLDY